MARYDVSSLEIDGEGIIFDDARLLIGGEGESVGWELVIDGAHILRRDEEQRVSLQMRTEQRGDLAGEARVRFAGHRDHDSQVYSGVELEGLGELSEA